MGKLKTQGTGKLQKPRNYALVERGSYGCQVPTNTEGKSLQIAGGHLSGIQASPLQELESGEISCVPGTRNGHPKPLGKGENSTEQPDGLSPALGTNSQ